MKYNKMSKAEIERVFAEDVLNLMSGDLYLGQPVWFEDDGHFVFTQDEFSPLTDLNHAMLGVEKLLGDKDLTLYFKLSAMGYRYDLKEQKSYWKYKMIFTDDYDDLATVIADTPEAAIVEACIRIVKSDLFGGE